jgi:hypothetical protein
VRRPRCHPRRSRRVRDAEDRTIGADPQPNRQDRGGCEPRDSLQILKASRLTASRPPLICSMRRAIRYLGRSTSSVFSTIRVSVPRSEDQGEEAVVIAVNLDLNSPEHLSGFGTSLFRANALIARNDRPGSRLLLQSIREGATGIEHHNSLRWNGLGEFGCLTWVSGTISATGSPGPAAPERRWKSASSQNDGQGAARSNPASGAGEAEQLFGPERA